MSFFKSVLKDVEVEMLVKTFKGGLSRFVEGCNGNDMQNGDEKGLYCMGAIVSGLKLEALVDSGATHSFVSEWTS